MVYRTGTFYCTCLFLACRLRFLPPNRTIYEDSVFAKMLRDSGKMDQRDYNTYIELFQNMSNFMKKPNIIVHLDVKPEVREGVDLI